MVAAGLARAAVARMSEVAPCDLAADAACPAQFVASFGLKAFRRNWHAQQIVALLQRMDSIPEGNGSLLDNTLVVWGRELGTTSHRMDPWPVVLAGSARGELQTGRFLQVGSSGTTGNGNNRQREPSAKRLVSIARLMGLDINSFGNIDVDSGPLAGIG